MTSIMANECTTRRNNENPSSSSSASSSSYHDDREVINNKINYIFDNININDNNDGLLIQFWALKDGLLSTFDQPFKQLGESNMLDYRRCSIRYQYSIDINDDADDVRNDSIISSSTRSAYAATAFLNRLPEIVVDLSVHQRQGNPLVDSALECGLTCSLFLPVLYRCLSRKETSCVGVIECCMKKQPSNGLVLVFDALRIVLERVGLSTFHVQQCQPYMTISSLKHATDEIEVALELVCESHYLNLAQVWIPNEESENRRVPFSSSSDDCQTKQKFAVKLIGHCIDLDDVLKDYYDSCDTFPLKIGHGLAGKTLQTHEPVFCRNIDEQSENGLLALLPSYNNCSCLTICLRSTHTGDLDYVFEFLWPRKRNCYMVYKSLLVTLKRCLPSFTFSFGTQSGDELHVLTALEGGKRSVAKECILSLEVKCNTTPIPLHQNDVKQQFGKAITGDARNHYDWQGRKNVKRKFSDVCESKESSEESAMSNGNSEMSPVDEVLIIKAEYEDDLITFHHPVSSATLAVVNKEIDMGFELSGHYKLRYLDEHQVWIAMESDEHVRHSIRSLRLANSTHIRLCVVPLIS